MEILTISQASKLCGVSLKTIINWIEKGYIKAYKTVGGHRRIQKEDLYTFMTAHNIPIPNQEGDDTRKKILIGAYFMEKYKDKMNELVPQLDRFLVRDGDRELFGLSPKNGGPKSEGHRSLTT